MVHGPVVESMQAREPGLQAPSNLVGSKTKNDHIFWPIEFFSNLRYVKVAEDLKHLCFFL